MRELASDGKLDRNLSEFPVMFMGTLLKSLLVELSASEKTNRH